MSGLLLLWWVALAIAGAALLIMLGLVAARLFQRWTGREREAERRRLVAILLEGRGTPAEVRRRDLLADVSVELIQLVRGSDREAFVETATRLGVPERLRHHLGSGSPRIRLAAAEALAEFADSKTVDSLTAALSDRHPDVRLASALSLASMGRTPPAPVLVERLGIGMRQNSLLAVALFREIAAQTPSEIRALILDPAVPAGAKAAAIEALSASVDYSLVPVVTTLALRADPGDPALPRYLRSLGAFGHPAALAAVRRGLGSTSTDVRAAAAEAAGRIALHELGPLLKALLADSAWWVRFRAGEALSRMGEEGARLLREAAAGGSGLAREAASRTMAERGLA